ncbi:hypothetical protein F5890DRAFT_1509997 [Lentinula detonsa]|uniref:Uncharacterized protein n=1 Tax=Lentinula detonsa TaxID=2804962 RepID=A0AA38Q0L8_9AGAR|nr:hypothetical protein F5890DRAFT_1509997 [Lentinula detonsa]
MSSVVAQEETSQPSGTISTQGEKVSRDSTGSNQIGSNGSGDGETFTKATATPEQSIASINNTASTSKHLDPSPALPLANPRKQKSTGILSLRRSPSGSRKRSESLSASAPKSELIPPLPTKKEPEQPPKSILTPSSSSSSLSHPATPSPSLSRSPSIQFAPLPQLAPRKRKSSVPLGIAARSAMMQRRRQIMYGSSTAVNLQNPKDAADTSSVEGRGMWTPAEAEEHMTRQLRSKEKERDRMLKKQQRELEKDATKSASRSRHGFNDEAEMGHDDPLVVFGRLMKDAWRRVGKKDGNVKVDLPAKAQIGSNVNSADTTTKAPSASEKPVESVAKLDQTAFKEAGNDNRFVNHESDSPDEYNDDEIDLDPNEVDVSKIATLRAGSPPPSHNHLSSQSQSETSSIAGSDETVGSDSTMTSPSPTSPPSPTTPTARTHTHISTDSSTLERTLSKNGTRNSVTIEPERSVHRLPSLELTPLSPFLVT